MLEILDGFPEAVIAVRASRRLTAEDYRRVLEPRVAAAAAAHNKLRCYYEIAPDLGGIDPGAAWEDARVGVGHWTRWERVALVTDLAWIGHLTSAFRFLMPGELKVFPTGEAAAARAWVTAA